MTSRERERLLRWYPTQWRARYGDELMALIEDQLGGRRAPLSLRVSLATSGLRERVHEAGIVGEAAPELRRRNGSLMVLVAWSAMVVAGAIVAKSSEHFAAAMAPASRAAAQHAYDVVVGAGATGTVLVLIGAVIALPSLGRLLSHGGWRHIRRVVAVTIAAWTVTSAATVAVSWWGHHLSAAARNGANPRYEGVAVLVGLLVVASIATSCVAAVKVVTTLELSPRVLRIESILAGGVGASALAVTLGTFAWWFNVATHASWFLQGSPRGVASSAWSTHLALASLIMITSLAVASWGMTRVMTSGSTSRA